MEADGAVRMGASLAADESVSTEILGVAEAFDFTRGIGSPPPEGYALVEAMRAEDLRLALAEQMRRVGNGSLQYQVAVGEVVETISRRAERQGVTAILLGGSRGIAAEYWMRRDTPLRVSHRSRIPVIAVQPTLLGPPRRVLAGIDFSSASTAAARVAVRMMAGGGTLYLVHVVPEAGEEEPFPSLATWRGEHERAVEQELERLAQALGASERRLGVQAVLARGDPAREILTLAHRMNIDLIAIGGVGSSEGRCGMPGVNATRVSRGPRCSVLIHPAPAV